MSPKQGRKRASGKGGGTPGSRKGGSAAPRASRSVAVNWRNLAIFGGGFVVLFAVIAVAVGIGHPSAGSGDVAVIEDAPSGLGTITEEEFQKALTQSAAKQQMPAPKPGDPKYDELKEAAIGELLTKVWLQGQAEEMGISATDKEVANKVKELETRQFKSKADYEKTIKEFHYTQADVEELLRIEILSQKIQEQFTTGAPKPSESEVKNYYEAAQAQYKLPKSRDVRLILNKDEKKAEEAKALLEKDDSPESWTTVAKKYSTDPLTKESGGLRAGLTETALEEPVNSAIFSAPEKKLEGPIKAGSDYYVFEVEKETDERVQSFDEVKEQISQQLQEQAGQENLGAFAAGFESKWRSRTFCGSDFLGPHCGNFAVSSDPAVGEPSTEKCRQSGPSKEIPEACPAPVAQTKPARPGSVTPLEKHGTPLAQRPRPAGLEESEENMFSTEGSIPVTPGP